MITKSLFKNQPAKSTNRFIGKNRIKIGFLSLFVALSLILTGCGTKTPQISVQDYNNELISLQESALDQVKSYFQALDDEYDGQNLSDLYTTMQENLSTLADKAQNASGYREDLTLKNAVLAYITGLQTSLDQHEKPIVRLLTSYSGSAQQFYEQDRSSINSGTLLFAQDLTKLDQALDIAQSTFAKKHKLKLP
ncbi:hypothetical protein HXK74_02105 [Candidatus Gracilibacteria bacterium]|nr:hypothetical protein [Candidatus Gracilibacteria bacterium]